jgi:hypothetical protein
MKAAADQHTWDAGARSRAAAERICRLIRSAPGGSRSSAGPLAERVARLIAVELRRASAEACEQAARVSEANLDCAWCDSKQEIAAGIRALAPPGD